MNPTRAMTPKIPMPISVGPQPLAGPSINAYTTHPRPIASADAPATSMEWSALGSRGLGDVAERQHERDRDERQVDEEHRAPRHRLDQPAAEEGPDRAGDAAEPRPRADGGAAIAGAERGGDDREAAGHEQRGGDPLDGACGDERDGRRREAADQGRGPERDETDEEELPASEAVAERAADHEERSESQQVGVEDPLESGEVGVEVLGDRGERGVHHAAVEEGDPDPSTAAVITHRPAAVPVRSVPGAAGAEPDAPFVPSVTTRVSPFAPRFPTFGDDRATDMATDTGKPRARRARRVDGVPMRRPSSGVRRRVRFGAAIALVAAMGAAGCAPSDSSAADRTRAARPPATSAPSTTATTSPAPTTTTLDLSVLPSCWPDPSFGQASAAPVPADLAAALAAFAADSDASRRTPPRCRCGSTGSARC